MVERRVDEQLEDERRSTALAGEQGNGRGEIASRTRAADGKAAAVESVLVAVLGDPVGRRVAILEPGGEWMLRRPPVGDGDHGTPTLVREPAADRVGDFERAEHPTAAEEVHEDRARARGVREVEAGGNVSRGPGQRAVEYLGDRFCAGRPELAPLGLA